MSRYATKPAFYKQTDKAWRNVSYGGMTLGEGGCGPSSIANVVTAVTGKKVTPKKVWKYMVKHGYIIPGVGSTWDGITKTLKHYKVNGALTYSDEAVRKALKNGKWILGDAGPSRWTTSGHFIVIYKLTATGKIRVSDPYSSSDYCQKNGTLSEYLGCNKVNWIIDPKDYPLKGKDKTDKHKTKRITLYVETYRANIRKGPGIKYGVKGVVKRGDKLTLSVHMANDGWYRIATGRYKGYYIAASVLTKHRLYEHVFKANVALNVRKGASSKAEILRTIKKGTKVTTSKRSGDWIYVPALHGWLRTRSADKKTNYMTEVEK